MFALTLTYYKGCIVTVINIIKHHIRHFIALLANINRTGGSRSSWATCTGARNVKFWCPLVSDLVNSDPSSTRSPNLFNWSRCLQTCFLFVSDPGGFGQYEMCCSHWSDGYTSSYFKQTWKTEADLKCVAVFVAMAAETGICHHFMTFSCAIKVFNGQ